MLKYMRDETKVRKVVNHECALMQNEDPTGQHIKEGYFVGIRRKFRKFLMVSYKNPESRSHLRSTARMQQEEEKHLKYYYYMIHPFSDGRALWELIMIFVYLSLFILIPVEILTPRTYGALLYSKFIGDLFCWIDIILFFNTGFFVKTKSEVVMNRKKVAIRYLLTYFIVDFASSLPINMIFHIFNLRRLHYIKVILLLKIVRLPTCMRYLHKFYDRMQFRSGNLKILNLIICFVFIIMWCTTIVFLLTNIGYGRDLDDYEGEANVGWYALRTVFDVLKVFYLVGFRERHIHNKFISMMIVHIICVLFGSVLRMVILGQIVQIYNRYSSARTKYAALMQQIMNYMKIKELSQELRNKILRYIDFKFQKRIVKETYILNSLSSSLRHDLLLQNCKTMIEKVEFFRDLPPVAVLRIATRLKSDVFLPNDIIVEAGDIGNCMYFIHIGTVAIYTVSRKEICHLYEGAHFGEISLMLNEPRVATVVAVSDCELYRLNRRDFQEAIDPFPDIRKKIEISAMSRLYSTNKIMDEDDTEN